MPNVDHMTSQANPENEEETPEGEAVPAAEGNAEAGEVSEQGQVAQLKDQLLRALAEAENTRRRAQKEREDTAKYAVSGFAKEMLSVADNFQRALESLPKDEPPNAETARNLIAGIEATERQLQAALARFGIKRMEPMGQIFDPNFHRVMMEVDDPAYAPGTVVKVLQPGYTIHDRLLREALVAVAKGGTASSKTIDTSA
ncbi:MAG TPA: nucleotide exchange factor GrpE [Alphaproteobacteria bacterium]|nr:nucleotide exchange factor GrpE [Alphaproteobacteria bacterium]